jgi:hypothetical protein
MDADSRSDSTFSGLDNLFGELYRDLLGKLVAPRGLI